MRSSKNLKGLKCPTKYNSSAIDEFLIIFLVAAKAKGVSYFKIFLNLIKEVKTYLGLKILNMMDQNSND